MYRIAAVAVAALVALAACGGEKPAPSEFTIATQPPDPPVTGAPPFTLAP